MTSVPGRGVASQAVYILFIHIHIYIYIYCIHKSKKKSYIDSPVYDPISSIISKKNTHTWYTNTISSDVGCKINKKNITSIRFASVFFLFFRQERSWYIAMVTSLQPSCGSLMEAQLMGFDSGPGCIMVMFSKMQYSHHVGFLVKRFEAYPCLSQIYILNV